MKNLKNIAFVTLVSLIVTSGVATQAMYEPSGDDYSMNNTSYTDLNATLSTYSSAGASSYSSGTGVGVGTGGDAGAYADGGNGYGGTAYNGGNTMKNSGNSDVDVNNTLGNIGNTNRATGGSSDANATAFGGGVYGSGNSDNTNIMTGGDNTNRNTSTSYGSTQGQGQTATTGNNTTAITTNNVEAANKTITYKKTGYDLPPAPPAISPIVIGQMGTTTYSGAISTPFGGISGGFSKTNKEGKNLMNAQADSLRVQADTIQAVTESQIINADIQNLKDAESLSPEDRAIIKEYILNKYRGY